MKPIQFSASYDGVSTKKDGSIGIRITSQELNSEQKVQAMEYVGKFGWFLFSPNQFTDDDIPKMPAKDESKTPSQRLRAVIYRYFETKALPKEKFDEFYLKQVEAIIQQYKSKLDTN